MIPIPSGPAIRSQDRGEIRNRLEDALRGPTGASWEAIRTSYGQAWCSVSGAPGVRLRRRP